MHSSVIIIAMSKSSFCFFQETNGVSESWRKGKKGYKVSGFKVRRFLVKTRPTRNLLTLKPETL
jgi:hypothetical protein